MKRFQMEDQRDYPSVTVIVPVRNGEKTIEPLMESLTKIDYDKDKIEVIVVDGNSTDKTQEIVKKYPFKLITEKKNGLNLARNVGIKSGNGDIIAFTDSDCIVPTNWIKKIVKNFEDPMVSCVGGSTKSLENNFVSQYADNSIVRLMPLFRKREELNKVKPFFKHPAGCNMAFRRKVTKEVGLFDEKIQYGFDEVEFTDRICKAGYKMILDPEVSVWHKHRSTFGELLKQNFQYGKGSGLVFKKNKLKDSVSRWTFLALIGFISWLGIIGSVSYLILSSFSSLLLWILFGFTGLPLIILASVYAYRAIRNKKFLRVLIYPFIDLIRTLSFCTGQVYQILFKN